MGARCPAKMSVAAGPLTDIQPQPPNAAIKVSAGRAKMTRQILTEIPNPKFALVRERPYAMRSRLRRVAGPCSPISGNAVAYRPQPRGGGCCSECKSLEISGFFIADRCCRGALGIDPADTAPDYGQHNRLLVQSDTRI